MNSKNKPKPERLAPYKIPFSPYALFQIALRGYDLWDNVAGKSVCKWEVWFRHQDNALVIARIKERRESRYQYIKK